MSELADNVNSDAGTARLWVVLPVAMLGFVYLGALDYLLPLYFGALQAVDSNYPADIYAQLIKYQVTPWIIGPILAGLLSRRYGERHVWCTAQILTVAIPLALIYDPAPNVVKIIALWSGLTGALMWIGGISLIQMVRPEKKGLSNGLMMGAVGVGGVLAPLGGRTMLYWNELAPLLQTHDWSMFGKTLLGLQQARMTPQVEDFLPIFWLLAVLTLTSGVLIGLWGQRSGRFSHDDQAHGWNRTLADLGRLLRNPRFWMLVGAMCFLGGPVFQATNQFLPYRAEDMGLKSGASDHGWIWLQLLKTLMWIPGGLAVGLLAGRRAPGIAAVMMLGCFALAGLGLGISTLAWQLFGCVALFEFMRQFMRWSQSGYLSEHMPEDLRATAIGCSISISGLGSTLFGWGADYVWNPGMADFNSATPFYAASLFGLIGCTGLLVFDRFVPIRQSRGGNLLDVESAVVLNEDCPVEGSVAQP